MKFRYIAPLLVALGCASPGKLDTHRYAQLGLKSRYLSPTGFTIEKDPALQGVAEVTVDGLPGGLPVTLGVFGNENLREQQLSEGDLYVKTKTSVGPVDMKGGLLWYEFTGPLEDVPDTLEGMGTVLLSGLPVTPELTMRLAKYGGKTGRYYEAALGKTVKLGEGFSATVRGSRGWLDNYFLDMEGSFHETAEASLKKEWDNGMFLKVGGLVRDGKNGNDDDAGAWIIVGRSW